MPVLWFQRPDGAPFQFQCMQGIHVPTLADELQLKPRPLKLNGVVVDFDSSTGYSPLPDLQEAMGEHAGTTRESAIQVTGQPAGAAVVSTVSGAVQSEQLQKLVEVADSLQLSLQLTQSMCQLILYDQLGPTSSSGSEKSEARKAHNSDYRARAIKFYNPGLDIKSPTLPCMLTGMEFDSQQVTAGHIYQAGWSRAFRETMGLAINDPGNVLLLVTPAETKFDQFYWTLKPLPPQNRVEDGVSRLMQPYKVSVLNPQLLRGNEQFIADHLQCGTNWADVQGRVLWFGAGEDEPKPLRRACGLHAMLAFRHAKQQGWLEDTAECPNHLSDEDLLVDEAAWASPTFNRARMDAFLADLPQPRFGDWAGGVEAA